MGTDRSVESTDTGKRTRSEQASGLGVKVWPKLKEIYDLIDAGEREILIRSCNGAGKSTLLASIICMEMMNNEEVQIICTGATFTALKNTLWRATKRLARAARLDVSDFTGMEWKIGNRHANCISPSKVESAQGFHADRVVILIDEATGASTDMLTALMSNATGRDSLILMTYNPVDPDAAVYELEQKWKSVGISAFDHPNVISGFEEITGAVTREFVESMLNVDTVECDWYYPDAIQLPWNNKAFIPTQRALARVCGTWSQNTTYGFISGAVVVDSWKVEPKSGLRVAGADIGAGDDPSVWTSFRGNEQMDFVSLTTGELGIVAAQIDKWCVENEIDIIGIDDTGVGHGVTDRLQELKPHYKIIPIHFGQSPKNFHELGIRKPSNARCEMYLLLEKEMRAKQIRISYDKELQRELCAQKIVAHKQSDTIKLEDKNLIKKRIGRSPNKADATAIARYANRLYHHYNQPRIL